MPRKVALIGVGKIAQDQHVPAIAASPDWELAGTVSRQGRVEGVTGYEGIDALLAGEPGIECLSLCLPPVPRFEYAAAALRAGRHVMLEKPPGASLAECHVLAALAREAGVSLYATWHSREAAQVEAVRDWLSDKTLRRLTITWKEDVRRWHPGQKWIWQAGGLGVFDPGINALSILTEILPRPAHLTAATLEVPENCETPIAAALDFHYPGGAEISAVFDFRQEGEQIWSMAIETEQGSLLLSEGGANLAIDGVPQAPPGEEGQPLGGEYPRLYAKMAKLIDEGRSDVDLSPLVLVADAFLLGKRITVAPFHE